MDRERKLKTKHFSRLYNNSRARLDKLPVRYLLIGENGEYSSQSLAYGM
jgi:hypothetical protein